MDYIEILVSLILLNGRASVGDKWPGRKTMRSIIIVARAVVRGEMLYVYYIVFCPQRRGDLREC